MSAALLAGCQVRPLYSQAEGHGQKLAAIAFSDPDNRVEQVVSNHLVFLTSGGAGEPLQPTYQVHLDVVTAYSNILDDDNAVYSQPGRVQVIGTYTLSRVSDGRALKRAQRQVTSLIDIPGQEFAELRAVRDAENRAARELAEFIRADLAIALSREPQASPVTWSK